MMELKIAIKPPLSEWHALVFISSTKDQLLCRGSTALHFP